MAARTKETPKGDAEVVEAPVEKSTGLVVTAAMVTPYLLCRAGVSGVSIAP